MADQKYQIFLSSTYDDLREERQQAVRAILQLNHIPSGMEWFPASGIEQFAYIKPLIDECDYYVLIVGGRYGTISPKTSKSFTDMEYEYALAQGKHILVFPHRSPQTLPGDKLEETEAGRLAFAAFRKKVTADMMAGFWSEPSELRAEIQSALTTAFKLHPRAGWVRADAPQKDNARRNREKKLALDHINELEQALREREDQVADLQTQAEIASSVAEKREEVIKALSKSVEESQKVASSRQRAIARVEELKAILQAREAENANLKSQLHVGIVREDVRDKAIEILNTRVKANEGMTIANSLMNERIAGSPPSQGLVDALASHVGGGALLAPSKEIMLSSVAMPTGAPKLSDLGFAASPYAEIWQSRLFGPFDLQVAHVKDMRAQGELEVAMRLLAPLLERLIRWTFLNAKPAEDGIATTREFISNIAYPNEAAGTATALKDFFECDLRVRLNDLVTPIEINRALSGAFEGITSLQGLWRSANLVLQADIPLFGKPNGENPWDQVKGIIVRRFVLGQEAETAYCVSSTPGISAGDFLTWRQNKQSSYQSAYYQRDQDLDLFHSGPSPFTGLPIRLVANAINIEAEQP